MQKWPVPPWSQQKKTWLRSNYHLPYQQKHYNHLHQQKQVDFVKWFLSKTSAPTLTHKKNAKPRCRRLTWPLPFMGGARSSHSSTLPCDWRSERKQKSGPFLSCAQNPCSCLPFSWAWNHNKQNHEAPFFFTFYSAHLCRYKCCLSKCFHTSCNQFWRKNALKTTPSSGYIIHTRWVLNRSSEPPELH